MQELLATAKKEAAIIHAEGEAEAAKIYNDAFSKDPEFYNFIVRCNPMLGQSAMIQ